MTDVYRIGVSIAMTNNASAVLGIIQKDVLGLHKDVDLLTGKWNAAKTAVVGLGAALGGAAVLGVMVKLVDKAIEFNQQIAMMKMANFSPNDVRTLTQSAIDEHYKAPGSTVTDNIKTAVDLRNLSGAAEHATALLDIITRTNIVLQNVTEKPAGEAGYKFMKFLEDSGRTMDAITGKFSEARVAAEAQWMQAVIVGTRGRVTGDDMFQLRQSGKASVNSLSDEGLLDIVPSVQSLGAVAVGTALQGAQQQLLGAVQLRQQTVTWMEKYHLLNPDKAHPGKGGFFKLDPGAITDEKDVQHNLTQWVWNTVGPQIEAELRREKVPEDQIRERVIDELKRSGLRTPLLGFVTETYQNEQTQKKEIGNIQTAAKVDQYEVAQKESPTLQITKFTAAWDALLVSLGSPITADATNSLNYFTAEMDKFSKWSFGHGQTVKDIEEVTAAIAAAAVGVGLIASIVAIGTAITPVGVAAIALVAAGAGLTKLFQEIASILHPFSSDGKTPATLEEIRTGHYKGGPNDPDRAGGAPTGNAPVVLGRHGPHAFDPIPVHVVNSGDVAHAITGGIGNGLARPQSGPTNSDPRIDMPIPSYGGGPAP